MTRDVLTNLSLRAFGIMIPMLLTLWVVVGGQQPVLAQDIARVRNEVDTKEAQWVGQRVPFHIDLMSASFFSGTAHFELPEISGVILMKVKGSPTVTSESVDDDTWSVQRHRFMAFAHRAGTIEIPPFEVRFSVSEGFGKPVKPQRMRTAAMKFESKIPPGAEGFSLLVSTTEMNVNEEWSVKPSKKGNGEERQVELVVGDAVSRKISMEARDIPAMALPRIPFAEIDGLSRYLNSPDINDQESRGALTGKRTESVTYICEQEGEYRIPGMVITWWDTEKKKLEKKTFPELSLLVKPDPNRIIDQEAEMDSVAEAGQGIGWTISLLVYGLVVAFVVYMGWRFLEKRVIRIVAGRREKMTEPKLFSKILAACQQDHPIDAHDALMKWIEFKDDGPNTPTLCDFVKKCDDNPELSRQFDLLQQAVIGKSKSWEGEQLAEVLQSTRKKYRSRTGRKQHQALPQLNP